jgi:HD-like signal output (HDOD) protein
MVSINVSPAAQLERAIRERLLADRVRIPPYPAVLARLQRCTQSGRLDEIAKLVGADSALAASVLARASSVLYGGQTAHLASAVARLGLDELLRLALTTSVAPLALASGPLSVLRRDAWRRALLGAHVTEILSKTGGCFDDNAFAAGLLHDLGEVVALACIEDIGRDHALPALDVASWRTLVQRVHVDLGMMIAARWDLPEPIAVVMACHHEAPAGMHADLIGLVAISDRIVDVLDRSPGTGIAALLEVPGVSSAARYAIGAALVDIAAQIAVFETPPTAPSPIVLRPPPPDGWPIDLAAERPRRGTYRARRISPDALQLTGAEPLTVNWLIDLKLATDPPLMLLVNIVSCEPGPGSEHTIVAAPYALDGDAKTGWLALLERARASAG